MADCRVHAGTAATANCAACAESFCGDCLVTVKAKPYCNDCKMSALPEDAGPKTLCTEANEALKYAVVSLFCFAFIIGPMAMLKAVKAKQLIAADARLGGAGRANAALVIGLLNTIVGVLSLVMRTQQRQGGF